MADTSRSENPIAIDDPAAAAARRARRARQNGHLNMVVPGAIAARPAQPQRRHRMALVSFLVAVCLPTVATVGYLYLRAADQYASNVAFTVRSGESFMPQGLLGALSQNVSTGGADAEIIYDYVRSQQMVEAVAAALPMEEIYGRAPQDFIFAMGADWSVEDKLDYWNRMTDISFDTATAMVRFEARAFDPDDAQRIATFVLNESTRIVNDLSTQAQDDAIGVARAAVADAEDRLRTVRRAMRGFRDTEQDADPTANARASQELVATLESDLARQRVQLDLLLSLVGEKSPRVSVLRQQIASMGKQVAIERERLGSGAEAQADGSGRRMSDVLSDYEELTVDLEFAQNAYLAALSAFEQAQIEARRQSRFLSPHIKPTVSVEARYPRRGMLSLAVFGLSLTAWSVALLMLYNVRDRR